MTTKNIYIRLIDGVETWVPINVSLIKDNQYEILDNPEFIDLDTNELFEFYPGDIIELEEHIFSNGATGQIAKKLISKGQWPDRKFYEFKFKAVLGQLNIDFPTFQTYRDEIERVKKESFNEKFIYPMIIETINKFNNLTKNEII